MPYNILLTSHARAPSEHNSDRIKYNRGKPETQVILECEGIRMRSPNELVHLRADPQDNFCYMCSGLAPVWMDDVDRWAEHPARCGER